VARARGRAAAAAAQACRTCGAGVWRSRATAPGGSLPIRGNLRLALLSLECLQAIRKQTGIEYDCATRSAEIYRDQAAFDTARGAAACWRGTG
jgi:hypothetical protein